MVRLFITLLVGSAGGLSAYKLRLPSGPLLGSMLAVGIYNCLGFEAFMPAQMRVGVQIVIGCILGLRLTRDTFVQLKIIIKPLLVIVVLLMASGLATGFVLYKFCNLDVYTAFLSSTPGGMTELSLLAATIGGDGPKVALLHTVRAITVVTVTPMMLHVMDKLLQKNKKEPVV